MLAVHQLVRHLLYRYIPASKQHKSLLEHDSDLDSNGPDEDNTRIEGLSEEEEPDSDDEPEQSQPMKILTPHPPHPKSESAELKSVTNDPYYMELWLD